MRVFIPKLSHASPHPESHAATNPWLSRCLVSNLTQFLNVGVIYVTP
jgi:hypothetical protein